MLYMVTWIPSIYPLYVSIYTSTMDPMGTKMDEFYMIWGFHGLPAFVENPDVMANQKAWIEAQRGSQLWNPSPFSGTRPPWPPRSCPGPDRLKLEVIGLIWAYTAYTRNFWGMKGFNTFQPWWCRISSIHSSAISCPFSSFFIVFLGLLLGTCTLGHIPRIPDHHQLPKLAWASSGLGCPSDPSDSHMSGFRSYCNTKPQMPNSWKPTKYDKYMTKYDEIMK